MSSGYTIRTRRGYRLWLRPYASPASKERPVILLCHGLGVASSLPFMVTLRKAFITHGYPVCIFDLAGHGKSGGKIQDRLVENFIADLGDSIKELRSQGLAAHGIVLVGYSIGALTSILYAGMHPKDVVGVVPIACNAEAHRKYRVMQEQDKIRVYRTFSIVGRTKVSKDFWNNRMHFEPKKFVQRLKVPVLYVCGMNDHTNPPEESRLLNRWTKAQSAVALIPGADHYFEPRAHQKAVAQKIILWLEKNAQPK